MLPHQELLIQGAFIGGPCDSSVPKSVVKSPWSGSVVGVAAEGLAAHGRAAVEAASEAAEAWSCLSLDTRRQALHRMAERLEDRAESLAQLMVQEIGKPISLARGEVQRAVLTLRLTAELPWDEADQPVQPGPDPRAPGYRISFRRRSLGAVVAITPYNWPINLAIHKIAPALLVGNTVVLKGSPFAALSTLALGRALQEADLPPGVLNVLHGELDLAQAICQHPETALVSFTGSPAVGWKLYRDLAPKPVKLELGGNAPALILPSANLERAARELAISAMGYAGQVCISAQNVIVHESVREEFESRLRQALEELPVGDPSLEETVCGPMIHAEAAERVRALIREAENHATVVRFGEDHRNLVAPTLILDPAEGSACLNEEVFGPVLTLRSFTDAESVIEHMNRSAYRLQASLYGDAATIRGLADKLKFGGVVLNGPPSTRFDAMPYGGEGASGSGREGPAFATEDFTRLQSIVQRES